MRIYTDVPDIQAMISMTDFSNRDVKIVHKLSNEKEANVYLVDGWELLLVHAGVCIDYSPVTGKLQEFPIIISWWAGLGAKRPSRNSSTRMRA